MTIPDQPPDARALITQLAQTDRLTELLNRGIGPAPEGKYRHWETIRRMKAPGGIRPEEFWVAQKMARLGMKRNIPTFVCAEGRPFSYTLPDPLLLYLHELDRRIGGTIRVPEPLTRETGQRFIQMSIMEEAITSSQLEGAATTRRVAKEMIRTGRKPLTTGERMILNNYRAMRNIRQQTEVPLTVALIEDVHATLTEGVSSEPITYREPGDGIGVYDNVTNTLLHLPPPAGETPERLRALCAFVNAAEHTHFMHPVVKAIILHFWFAYVHPFQDGNGRTARALFYWYLLKQDFWIAEYVSISRILKKAPARYAKSFLYSETDDNDLTYFILSQMKVLLRSVEDLFAYMSAKSEEIQSVSELLSPGAGFNHRQRALLSHALRHPRTVYTIESHLNSHGVSYQTARTDVLTLAEKGLLSKSRLGRAFVFIPVDDLAERLRGRT